MMAEIQISVSIEPYLGVDIPLLTQYLNEIVKVAANNPQVSLHFDYFIDDPKRYALVRSYANKIPTDLHLMAHPNLDTAGFRMVARDAKELTADTTGLVLDLGCDFDQMTEVIKRYPQVILMSVKCGKSGQTFHPEVLDLVPKIRKINPQAVITIDGGVNENNIALINKAGIDRVVVGSYAQKCYENGDLAKGLNRLLHV